MFYCGITLAFSIQISEILVQEFHFTSALTDKTFRTSTNQISQIERLYNLYRNSCFLILIYLQPSKWRVNVQWKLDNHRKARCLKRTLHRHWNDNRRRLDLIFVNEKTADLLFWLKIFEWLVTNIPNSSPTSVTNIDVTRLQ